MKQPRTYDCAGLQARIVEGDSLVLLDVREPVELQVSGWLAGMTHIPIMDLPQRFGELDREKEIVVYCAHGIRSWDVACYLAEQGFQNVASLDGGLAAWQGEIERK
jgi:adenylyltransferase/sulfurtransferase